MQLAYAKILRIGWKGAVLADNNRIDLRQICIGWEPIPLEISNQLRLKGRSCPLLLHRALTCLVADSFGSSKSGSLGHLLDHTLLLLLLESSILPRSWYVAGSSKHALKVLAGPCALLRGTLTRWNCRSANPGPTLVSLRQKQR